MRRGHWNWLGIWTAPSLPRCKTTGSLSGPGLGTLSPPAVPLCPHWLAEPLPLISPPLPAWPLQSSQLRTTSLGPTLPLPQTLSGLFHAPYAHTYPKFWEPLLCPPSQTHDFAGSWVQRDKCLLKRINWVFQTERAKQSFGASLPNGSRKFWHYVFH